MVKTLKKMFKFFVSDAYIRARTENALRRIGYTPEYIAWRKLQDKEKTTEGDNHDA
jgi:hypothetical protein